MAGLCLATPAALAAAANGRDAAHGYVAASPSPVTRFNLGRETRPSLPGSRATLPISVPRGAVLEVGFGVSGSAWKGGLEEVELTITFVSGGRRTPLWRQRLTAGPEQWQDVAVPLTAVAGRSGALELDHRTVRGTAAPDGAVHWTNPRIGAVARGGGPSLILLSIDTLRADHLGCYGYGRDTSPTIDRLARQGVLFRQMIATSSWTLPSHASMLTGLYPPRHGATRFGKQLRHDYPTVAELLWNAGYATAGFTGGGFVAATFGFDRGFDRYWSENVLATLSDEIAVNLDRSLQWMQTVRDRPFFLFLHTYAAHVPYKPPAETNIFDPTYEGPFKTAFKGREHPTYASGIHDLDARTIHHLEALYDAGIRHIDGILARLVAVLEQRDDTCLIITSDHGEEFNEHGHILHSQPKLYDELLRVPLIVWCPSRYAGGRVIEQPVSLVDLTPTLLEIAGAPVPPGLDGISLEPALAGRPQQFRDATVSEVSRALIKEQGVVRAVRTGREKLIVSDPDRATQLFDLADDPGETRDLGTAARPQRAAYLSAVLDSALRATPHAAAVPAKPDQATLERLRALGYAP